MLRRLLFLCLLIAILMGLIAIIPMTRNEVVPAQPTMEVDREGTSISLVQNDNFVTIATDFGEDSGITSSSMNISAVEGEPFSIEFDSDGVPLEFAATYSLSTWVPQIMTLDQNQLDSSLLVEIVGCHFSTFEKPCVVLAHIILSTIQQNTIIMVDVEAEYHEESNLKVLYFPERIIQEIDDTVSLGFIEIKETLVTVSLDTAVVSNLCFVIADNIFDNVTGQTSENDFVYERGEDPYYTTFVSNVTYAIPNGDSQRFDVHVYGGIHNCDSGEELSLFTIDNPVNPLDEIDNSPATSLVGVNLAVRNIDGHDPAFFDNGYFFMSGLPSVIIRTMENSELNVYSYFSDDPEGQSAELQNGVQLLNLNYFEPAPGLRQLHFPNKDSDTVVDTNAELNFRAEIFVYRAALEALSD